jgi:MFS family permease
VTPSAELTTRSMRRDAVLLIASSFAVATSNSVIFAALGDLQDTYGFGESGLGLVAGTGFVAGLLGNLFLAPLADRGHAKRLIMSGMALGAVGSAMLALGDSLLDFVVARAVIGLSFGLVFPSVRALLANLDPARRGLLLGRLAGSELLGFVVGPLVGGLMIDPFGLPTTFLAFSLVNLAALAAVAPRSFPPLASTGQSARPSLELLALPRVQVAVLVFMAMQAPVGIFDAMWDRYLTDLGAGNSMVGISFALYTAPFILLSSRGGRLADRREPQSIALWSMLLVIPAVASYGAFRSLPPVVAANVAEGVFQALAYPAAVAAVAAAAPAGRAGAAQGLAGAAGLMMSAVIAFTAPVVYGWAGSADGRGGIAAFGGLGVVMAVLVGAAALRWRTVRDLPVS